MANLRLKKLILEVVDNQLRENNPPVTKESYDKLIDAGYSAREAKEKNRCDCKREESVSK